MRSYSKLVCSAAIALLAAAGACAITRDLATDHYQGIPARNLFGLKPREEPATNAPPPQPLRKVILTGITTLPTQKHALLRLEPLPGHPAEKGESLILAEGQREGEIKVVHIDECAGTVTLKNAGSLMTITFDKQPPKPPASQPRAPIVLSLH